LIWPAWSKKLRAMRRLVGLLGLLVWMAGCGGCTHPPAVVDAGPERSVPDETVQPVFDATGPVLPEATRLCNAVHALPEERTAACCHRAPSASFAAQCAAVLSSALRGKNLSLDTARLDTCVADLERVHAGCEWVGPIGVPMPHSCDNLLVGKVASGARCRSTLECEGALRCLGSGPTDTGVCGEARGTGGACRLSVDGLGPQLAMDVDRTHPECQGFCDHHRCQPRLAPGATCVTSGQCPAEQRCLAGKCATAGKGGAGQACSDDECTDGLRCVFGRCVAPKHAGESCTGLSECSGRCDQKDGGGICVMGC
jgi:hypothetical protein